MDTRRGLVVVGLLAVPSACGGQIGSDEAVSGGAGGSQAGNGGTGQGASSGSGATGGWGATGATGQGSTGGTFGFGGTGGGSGGTVAGGGGSVGGTGGHCSLTPCPDPALPYCYPPTLMCVECLNANHCGGAAACVDQVCVGSCRTDADCPGGQRCDTQGRCGPAPSCDGRACEPVNVLGLIDLYACCPAGPTGTGCGLDMTPVNALVPAVPAECIERRQAGTLDGRCRSSALEVPTFGLVPLTGCCRPDGVCGALLDLSDLALELDFGCVEASRLGLPPQPCGAP